MRTLPTFHSRVFSTRYGPNSMDVYHDRSECQRGQKIREDHNEELGEGGRRHCPECLKYGAA